MFDVTANLRAAGPSAATLAATTSTRRYALLQLKYATAAGSDGVEYAIGWQGLVVYGNHGLTVRGATPGGFYPADIVGHALTHSAQGSSSSPTTHPA